MAAESDGPSLVRLRPTRGDRVADPVHPFRAERALAALPGGVIAGASTGLLYAVAVLAPGLVLGDPSSSPGLLLIGMLVGSTLGMLVGALAGALAAGLLALLWRWGAPAGPAAVITGSMVGGGVVAALVWFFAADSQTLLLASLGVAQASGGLALLTWWARRPGGERQGRERRGRGAGPLRRYS